MHTQVGWAAALSIIVLCSQHRVIELQKASAALEGRGGEGQRGGAHDDGGVLHEAKAQVRRPCAHIAWTQRRHLTYFAVSTNDLLNQELARRRRGQRRCRQHRDGRRLLRRLL